MKYSCILFLIIMTLSCKESTQRNTQQPKLKVLIIDGQNNHYVWPKATAMMKSYLKQTGLFKVDVKRTDPVWPGIKYNSNRAEPLRQFIEEFLLDSTTSVISPDPVKHSNFNVNFSEYDLIISNLGDQAAAWPEVTQRKFEQYMYNGGGLLVVHAANNVWGSWIEFNKMIGLGAWGGRDSSSGPYVFYNDDTNKIQKDYSEGVCGSHGMEHEFVVTSRDIEHPVMKGLPKEWLHAKDELYDHMRGPFTHATILATAFSDVDKNEQPWEPKVKGSGRHVPVLMAIQYGNGRVFHTTLGHFDYSLECAGFITTFQRGAEWAATGAVTQDVPEDFPSKHKTSSRPWEKES